MSDRIREATADFLDAFGETGRWILAVAFIGGAGMIVARALIAP